MRVFVLPRKWAESLLPDPFGSRTPAHAKFAVTRLTFAYRFTCRAFVGECCSFFASFAAYAQQSQCDSAVNVCVCVLLKFKFKFLYGSMCILGGDERAFRASNIRKRETFYCELEAVSCVQTRAPHNS